MFCVVILFNGRHEFSTLSSSSAPLVLCCYFLRFHQPLTCCHCLTILLQVLHLHLHDTYICCTYRTWWFTYLCKGFLNICDNTHNRENFGHYNLDAAFSQFHLHTHVNSWEHYVQLSHALSLCLLLYMYRMWWCSRSAAALLPSINQSHFTEALLFFSPLFSACRSLRCQVSVFSTCRPLKCGTLDWRTLNGWQSSLWAAERSPGFMVEWHSATMSGSQVKSCTCLVRSATCAFSDLLALLYFSFYK